MTKFSRKNLSTDLTALFEAVAPSERGIIWKMPGWPSLDLAHFWALLLAAFAFLHVMRVEAQGASAPGATITLPEVFDASAIPPPDLQPYLLGDGRFIDKCRYWHDHPDWYTRQYGQPDKFRPGQPMGETRSFNGQPAPYLRCAIDPCPEYGTICWRNPAFGLPVSRGNMDDTMKNVDASCRRVLEQGGSRPGCKPLQGGVDTQGSSTPSTPPPVYTPPLSVETYQFDGQKLEILIGEGWVDNHQVKGVVHSSYFGTAEGTVGTKKDSAGNVITSNGQPIYYFNLRSLTVRATGKQLIPKDQPVEIIMQVPYHPY